MSTLSIPRTVKCPPFSILGPPRTKKTHNRIARFGKDRQFTKILPSKEHELWHKLAMQQAPLIRAQLIRDGIHLPISEAVGVKALFYREANTGDLTGYMQALGDFLQESRQRKGKTVRSGAGVILDDRQICSWDGTRNLIDRRNPRIEVVIEILPGGQIPIALEDEW